MTDEKKFKRNVVNIIIVTAVVLLAEVTAVFWLFRAASSRAAEIMEKKSLLSSLQEEVSSFDLLSRDYERVKPFINSLESALPKEEGLAEALDDLESIGGKLGIRLSVKLESQSSFPADIPGVRFVPFSAILASGYSGFKQFLEELDASPLFVEIDSFSINSPASINSGGNIVVQGRIHIR